MNLGQYFTKDKDLQITVKNYIRNNPECILEPSCGEGDLVFPEWEYDCFEIDDSLKNFVENVNICDFLEEKINKKYKTIIGNPPFVRTRRGNLFIDFVTKCVDLLDYGGELIFIVPSCFFRMTSASKILTKMFNLGSFTDVYYPHKENLFKGAAIDVVIFRYEKDVNSKEVLYNGERKYANISNGIVVFNDEKQENILLSDYFDVYVGQVSGKESVFKNSDYGNKEFLTDEGMIEKYIYLDKFPTDNDKLNEYMNINKESLMSRKIRKFNDKNWFEWGAKRNVKIINQENGKKCIYVRNITRKQKVAFIDKVKPFCAKLLIMIPKKEIDLEKIQNMFNSESFRKKYTYSGRFKIGHKELSNVNLSNMVPEN